MRSQRLHCDLFMIVMAVWCVLLWSVFYSAGGREDWKKKKAEQQIGTVHKWQKVRTHPHASRAEDEPCARRCALNPVVLCRMRIVHGWLGFRSNLERLRLRPRNRVRVGESGRVPQAGRAGESSEYLHRESLPVGLSLYFHFIFFCFLLRWINPTTWRPWKQFVRWQTISSRLNTCVFFPPMIVGLVTPSLWVSRSYRGPGKCDATWHGAKKKKKRQQVRMRPDRIAFQSAGNDAQRLTGCHQPFLPRCSPPWSLMLRSHHTNFICEECTS